MSGGKREKRFFDQFYATIDADPFGLPMVQRYVWGGILVINEYLTQGQIELAAQCFHLADDPGVGEDAPFVKGGNSLLVTITRILEERGLKSDVQRLWKRVAGDRRSSYWSSHRILSAQITKDTESEIHRLLSEKKRWALFALEHYREFLVRGDCREVEIAKIELAIEEINQGNRRPPDGVKDKRKIDEDLFWTLIEEVRQAEQGTLSQADALVEKLQRFRPGQIVAFERILQRRIAEAYREDIWAVAYIIQNGCSDDGFLYFIGWLLSQGREFYRSFLQNPEETALTLSPNEDYQAEEILSVAYLAYQESTSGDIYETVALKEHKRKGYRWQEKELPELYPRLWQKFWADPAVDKERNGQERQVR
jgi:hypothetical protein